MVDSSVCSNEENSTDKRIVNTSKKNSSAGNAMESSEVVSAATSVDKSNQEDIQKIGVETVNPAKPSGVAVDRGQASDDSDEPGQINTSSDSDEQDKYSTFDDGYDSDLMGNSSDREALRKMSEIERENELLKRAERRDAMKTRWEITQRLRDKNSERNKNVSGDFNKHHNRETSTRSGISASRQSRMEALEMLRKRRMGGRKDLIDSPNRNTIWKRDYSSINSGKEGGTYEDYDDYEDLSSDSHERYRGSRQVSSTKYSRKRSNRDQKRSRRDYSDIFIPSEDEFIKLEEKENDREVEEMVKGSIPISSYDELNKMRITRWIFDPHFDEKVLGLMVRIAVQNENGSVYEIGQITGVEEGAHVYDIDEFRIKKLLVVKIYDAVRKYRIEYISNSPISKEEAKEYFDKMEKMGLPLPTMSQYKQKVIDLLFMSDFKPNEKETNMNNCRKLPVNITLAKDLLKNKAFELTEQGKHDEVADIYKEIERLDKELEKKFESTNKRNEMMRGINERNRRANRIEIEKALQKEITRWNQVDGEDPFSRRRTNPVIMMDSYVQRTYGDYVKKKREEYEQRLKAEKELEESKKQVKEPEKNDFTEEMRKLHDFDLEIDLSYLPAYDSDEEKTKAAAAITK